MPDAIGGRFAPSPTGMFHVGGARSALFNWALARQAHGRFVLRIEDTDAVRNRPEWVEGIISALAAIGISRDDPAFEGPYFQSHSTGLHREASLRLFAEGKVPQDEASWAKAMTPVAAGILASVRKDWANAEWTAEVLRSGLEEAATEHGLKLGKAQAPVRVALTGRTIGSRCLSRSNCWAASARSPASTPRRRSSPRKHKYPRHKSVRPLAFPVPAGGVPAGATHPPVITPLRLPCRRRTLVSGRRV